MKLCAWRGAKIMIKDLIKKNRSVRGYDASREVTNEELHEMVDCAKIRWN